MKSFRLQFIDRDSSYTISTAQDDIKGFMVVRAPKGTTEAMYFGSGNEKHINAMIGVPTANWTDLYEAVTFNESYGLYISAPAGTSAEYPSYYGGCYLTTKGLRNFWHVQDKDNLNYEIKVKQGSESVDYDPEFATDTEIIIDKLGTKAGSTSIIKVLNISPKMKSRLSYFDLNWPISKDENEIFSFHVKNDRVYAQIENEDTDEEVGHFELEEGTGTYTLTLGGYNKIDDFPSLDLTKIFNVRGNSDNGTAWLSDDVSLKNIVWYDGTYDSTFSIPTGEDLVKKLIIEGQNDEFTLSNGLTTHTFPAFEGLKSRLYWRINIKQDTFLAISQKSPTETPTFVTIENIGYDKYVYEHNVKYISKNDFFAALEKPDMKSKLIDAISTSSADFLVDVIDYNYDNEREVQKTERHAIYKFDPDTLTFADVTHEFKTQTFYLSGKLSYKFEQDEHFVIIDFDSFTQVKNADGTPRMARGLKGGLEVVYTNTGMESEYDGTVWEVAETGKIEKFRHTFKKLTGNDLRGNINYNTVTISCKEEVYPGEFTDGGTFTGSLDEKGVDASGHNLFFPNVLPKDTVTFIEVTVVNKLEDLGLIDEKGFWQGTKIVDPIGPAVDTYTESFAGDRFCTYVNQLNQRAGTLGCAWRNEYEAIINEGLIEAKKDDYDDALVFMELTGQERFKEKLLAMRQKDHQTSTFISPKVITKAEFDNPSSIVVNARGNGTAQYVGEFKCYDSYTGKYYWRQPIGAVGSMLARIMDVAMGGQSPAGTNTSNGCGGQLPISCIEPRWKWTDEKLKVLAQKKRINPITFDNAYGMMMMDDKSTQHPDETTDWSYLGHQMSFDLAKRELREKVMAPQLFKRISAHYMEVRERDGNEIMRARCGGDDAPWSYGKVSIFEENTPITKAKRQFVIKAECRVTPTSDTVLLIWENLPQE